MVVEEEARPSILFDILWRGVGIAQLNAERLAQERGRGQDDKSRSKRDLIAKALRKQYCRNCVQNIVKDAPCDLRSGTVFRF